MALTKLHFICFLVLAASFQAVAMELTAFDTCTKTLGTLMTEICKMQAAAEAESASAPATVRVRREINYFYLNVQNYKNKLVSRCCATPCSVDDLLDSCPLFLVKMP